MALLDVQGLLRFMFLTSHLPPITLDTTVNFVRDYLVERLNCTATPLQLPNSPAQTATLYPYSSCSGNTIIDFCTGAGFSTIEGTQNVMIYPNPASELLHVKWNEGMEASIELFDQSGRLLQKMTGNSGTFSFRVDNLEMGSYVMNFSFENGFSQSYKWIKY